MMDEVKSESVGNVLIDKYTYERISKSGTRFRRLKLFFRLFWKMVIWILPLFYTIGMFGSLIFDGSSGGTDDLIAIIVGIAAWLLLALYLVISKRVKRLSLDEAKLINEELSNGIKTIPIIGATFTEKVIIIIHKNKVYRIPYDMIERINVGEVRGYINNMQVEFRLLNGDIKVISYPFKPLYEYSNTPTNEWYLRANYHNSVFDEMAQFVKMYNHDIKVEFSITVGRAMAVQVESLYKY